MSPPGRSSSLPNVQPAVQVELAARPARTGRAGLPEVLRARAQDDPLARDADRQPDVDRVLVRAEAELLVALEHRDPDVVRVEAEALQRQLPGELRRVFLEVVADAEVAQHLEAREVARRQADLVDVRRAEALLARRQAVVRRLLSTLEVGLERVHARRGEQYRRIVLGGDERPGRQPLVVATFEEAEEALADLVGGHRDLSLGCSPCASSPPASSTRTAGCGSTRTALEREDGTPGLYGWIEMAPAALVVPIDDDHVWLDRAAPAPARRALLGVSAGRLGARSDGRARGPRAAGARRGDRPARRADGAPRPPALHATGSADQASTSGVRPGSNPASRRSRRTEQDLVVRRFTVDEVDRMVRENEIRDAASVAAWHLATR